MRTPYLLTGSLLYVLAASTSLLALDQLSGSMKQILDHRADDFATIRKDAQVTGDETDYTSTLMVAGAKECYIAQTTKPHYSESCEISETKSRAILATRYKKFVKALQDASPAAWTSWTESTRKPAGESTYFGPDRSHPAAAIHWDLEGMNMDWYDLSVTFYAEGYTLTKQ